MAQKPVLGKGLASLLPGAPSTATTVAIPSELTASAATTVVGSQAQSVSAPLPAPVVEPIQNKDRHPGISLLPIEEIQVNEFQPRRDFDEGALAELTASIETNGIIQPLVVRKTDNGYQLIAGERRLRAATRAGIKQVPVVIRRSTDKESLELALVENIQRQDLNCIDEALAYFQLIEDFSLTQDEVAKRVGKDRASVANHLRLLRLSETTIEDLRSGRLTFGHGKVLLSVEGLAPREALRKEILENGLSVRESEKRAEAIRQAAMGHGAEVERTEDGQPKVMSPLATRLFQIAQNMTRRLSTRVEVKGNEKKGRIVVYYSGKNEFDRIIHAMEGDQSLWPETSL
jgi:ParB family chromosome partitioning protein